MPKFFASAPRGLEPALESELTRLKFAKVIRGMSGVYFEGSWKECYRANLESRVASRILYPVLDFVAYEPDQIYHGILKHDWTKYISVEQTLRVTSQVRDSIIRDSAFVNLKVKDAVVDQFRDKFGKRPDVASDGRADLPIVVRLVKNQVSVSLDTSGQPLHERGYRELGAEAPLKENLAAGLIGLTKWDPDTPFLDPMCGSGTLSIEAALKIKGIKHLSAMRNYAFESWKTYQKEVFETERIASVVPATSNEVRIFGFDRSVKSVEMCQRNAKRAEVSSLIQFQKVDLLNFSELPELPERGTLLTNPPYGERLAQGEDVLEIYRTLGNVLRERFRRWKCYVMTLREGDFLAAMNAKATKSMNVYNGSIACQLLELDLRT